MSNNTIKNMLLNSFCPRCKGTMLQTRVYSEDSLEGIEIMRCFPCGFYADSVILEHKRTGFQLSEDGRQQKAPYHRKHGLEKVERVKALEAEGVPLRVIAKEVGASYGWVREALGRR